MISKKASQFNLNSILALIAIGVMGWNLTKVQSLSEKMARVEALAEVWTAQQVHMDKRIDTIEAIIGIKPKQLP